MTIAISRKIEIQTRHTCVEPTYYGPGIVTYYFEHAEIAYFTNWDFIPSTDEFALYEPEVLMEIGK